MINLKLGSVVYMYEMKVKIYRKEANWSFA